MKYVTFEHHGREQVGALDTAANRIYPPDLDGMIAVIPSRARNTELSSKEEN
jgi:hypothetical protein